MEKHFVVKEHQANYTIGNLEPEDLFNFLNQSISIVKGLQSFDEEIGDYLKEISENSETNALAKPDLETVLTDDDIDELLEIIEAAEIQNFDAIIKFYNHCYSTWDSLNAYIKNTLVIIKEFNVIVTKYSSSWTCPSFRDLNTLSTYGKDIIKNLLFIVYFEFDMESVNCQEKDERFYIDEIYDKFCKHYGLNPEEYTKSINDLRSIYKIKLNFFDEYPELEEPFEAMMGPNIINIDEDKITLDIVKQVLNQGSAATISAESRLSSDHVRVLAKQPQYTSKRLKNLYKKRNNSIQDYLHKLTKFITNYCVKNEINTVIIGDLTGIKNRITNRDKKYNQKLHELPYEKIRILLEYKLACKGINFVLQNECYTSQCAPNTPSVERKYANKLNRVQRGLYVSEGNIYNADAVGAYNILRKYCDEHGIKKTFSIKGLTSVKVFKIKR